MPTRTARPVTRKATALGIGFIIVLTGFYYAWIVGQNSRNPYYLPFTDGYVVQLAHGHADLGVKPDPNLVASSKPYDPATARGARILFDASYFRGHYYVYFGIVPFAELLVPFYGLTGRIIPVDAAVGIYAFGSFSVAAFIVVLLARRSSTQPRSFLLYGSLLLLGLGTPTLLLLRRPEIYELEIAAGWFHGALGIFFSILASGSETRRFRYLILASLCLALGIGCRPQYVIVVVTSLPYLYWILRNSGAPSHRKRLLLSLLIPTVAVSFVLGCFNWARFGNPLEFGFRYQLVSYDRQTIGFISLRNIPYNLCLYLFGGARLSQYFPWFLGQANPLVSLPVGHEETDQIYGCLIFSPILWLLLRPIASAIRYRRCQSDLPLLLPILLGLSNLVLFLVMGNGAYRYLADFEPPLLLALVGYMISRPVSGTRLWADRLFTALGFITAISFQGQQFALYDRFRTSQPKAFSAIERIADQPVFLKARLQRDTLIAPRITVKLPSNQIGHVEPLLVTGERSQQDFIYIYYESPGSIRIGFEATGYGGPLSNSIPIDYSKPHTFQLLLGSFLPPPTHPLFSSTSTDDYQRIASHLIVWVDDKPLFDTPAEFHPVRKLFYFAESPFDAAFGKAFSGIILAQSDEPVAVEEARRISADYAEERTTFQLDLSQLPPGEKYPLFSFGLHPHASSIYINRATGNVYNIGLMSQDQPTQEQALHLQVPPPHSVEILLLAAKESPTTPMKLTVNLGGTSLHFESHSKPAPISSFSVGRNAAGLSTLAPTLPEAVQCKTP
jgi:hypothetical protein